MRSQEIEAKNGAGECLGQNGDACNHLRQLSCSATQLVYSSALNGIFHTHSLVRYVSIQFSMAATIVESGGDEGK